MRISDWSSDVCSSDLPPVPLMRRLWQALLGLVALLLIAGLAGFIWVRSSLPKTDGEIAVAGLGAPVDVIRDAHGVPHIFANTAVDAYFALGFVHAQDRLWQRSEEHKSELQ